MEAVDEAREIEEKLEKGEKKDEEEEKEGSRKDEESRLLSMTRKIEKRNTEE